MIMAFEVTADIRGEARSVERACGIGAEAVHSSSNGSNPGRVAATAQPVSARTRPDVELATKPR